MSTLPTQYDVERYNFLPSIEDADEDMRRRGLLKLAEDSIAPLFFLHRMSEEWGIVLLHRHWALERNEVPIQAVLKRESPKEFEMAPTSPGDTDEFWPVVMAISSDINTPIVPLEFTKDEAAKKGFAELVGKPEFVSDLQRVMVSQNLQTTFGLIFTKNVDHNRYELVEFNSEKRVSLVRECTPLETDGLRTIQTSWRFHSVDGGTVCTGSCFSKCVIPKGGGHYHEHPHAHQP